MTTKTLPPKVKKEAEIMSQNLGISMDDFMLNALLYYIKRLKNVTELKSELKAWDIVSDLDLLKFEKSI